MSSGFRKGWGDLAAEITQRVLGRSAWMGRLTGTAKPSFADVRQPHLGAPRIYGGPAPSHRRARSARAWPIGCGAPAEGACDDGGGGRGGDSLARPRRTRALRIKF